jgi:hypothetical protein
VALVRVESQLPQKVVPLSGDWAQFLVRFDDVNLDRASVSSVDFVIEGRCVKALSVVGRGLNQLGGGLVRNTRASFWADGDGEP